MTNPLHKPDDALTIDCILHFHTAVLLSCLLHSACIFEATCEGILIFVKCLGLSLVVGTHFHFFTNFPFFEERLF